MNRRLWGMSKGLKSFKASSHKDPKAAVDAVREIYDAHVAYLREGFTSFSAGQKPDRRVSACYPYVKIKTDVISRVDMRLSYGFVTKPGSYMSTVTRPDIYDGYFREQMRLLLLNHSSPIEVGV